MPSHANLIENRQMVYGISQSLLFWGIFHDFRLFQPKAQLWLFPLNVWKQSNERCWFDGIADKKIDWWQKSFGWATVQVPAHRSIYGHYLSHKSVHEYVFTRSAVSFRKKFRFQTKISTSEMWSVVNARDRNLHKFFSYEVSISLRQSIPFVYSTFEHVLEYKMQFSSRRFLVENKTITLNGMVVVCVSSCVSFP